jgi:hypothetical protein
VVLRFAGRVGDGGAADERLRGDLRIGDAVAGQAAITAGRVEDLVRAQR